jgi:hypothetical protein
MLFIIINFIYKRSNLPNPSITSTSSPSNSESLINRNTSFSNNINTITRSASSNDENDIKVSHKTILIPSNKYNRKKNNINDPIKVESQPFISPFVMVN